MGEDKAGIKENLKKFVDAYNELMGTAKDLTRVTSVGEDKAPVTGGLVGDATVRNLVNGVRAELSGGGGSSGGLSALAELGIAIEKDGKLKMMKKRTLSGDVVDKAGRFFDRDNGLITAWKKALYLRRERRYLGMRQKEFGSQRSELKTACSSRVAAQWRLVFRFTVGRTY